MKLLALSTVRSLSLALTSSVLLSPSALASGWIVVDPIAGGAPVTAMIGVPLPVVVPPPIDPVRPIRPHPGHPVRPLAPPVVAPPHTPVLHGGVSFGLHLESEDIKVDVNNQVARTNITQTFANDTDRNLAGTYLFPLPEDTTFSSFSLHIDGKPVEGKILEANEARQQYETIVRQMVDPGLLEYADYKTVRARIFPIPAHGTKKVELEYTQVLKAENGMLKYRFPLKANSNDQPVENVKISVNLRSKEGLRTIWSPTHVISTARPDNNNAKVSMSESNINPDKDFFLYYSVSDKDLAANLVTHKNPGEDGYFLMTLSPPVKAKNVSTKDIVLVADTSGSMAGAKMEENKKALKYIVNALSADDRFGLVEFNTDAESLAPHLMQATEANKKKAAAFIDDLEARGGTNIGEAMHIGCALLDEVSDRPAYLVLMTDGEPTVGETTTEGLISQVKSKRDLRIFDFGVGYDVNTKLLNKLAEQHHGSAQYVEPSESIETALGDFYQKIKSPVLTNVKIAYEGIQVKDVYPREVKDIFSGSQVLMIGKFKNDGNATVKLTGTVNGVQKAYSFPLHFASDEGGNSSLPRLWAMRRIGHLTDVAQANGDNREVVDEIVALSKKYGIITAYTSYLVTDPSENHRLPMQPPVAFGGRPGMPMAQAMNGAVRIMDDRSMAKARKGTMAFASSTPYRQRGGAAGGMSVAEEPTSVTGSLPAPPPISADAAFQMVRRELKEDEKQSVGKDAVDKAKAASVLKTANSLANESNQKSLSIKTVADKTFYLRDGFWVDSMVDSAKGGKPQQVTFASKEYFDLLHANPGISRYLAVGQQVIVNFNGKCYKIVQATQT